MTCPKCGSRINEQAHFCPQCGTQLSQIRVKRKCPHCGAEIAAQVSVCPECGQSLASAAGASRAPRAQAPRVEAPRIQMPRVESPRIQMPHVQAPRPSRVSLMRVGAGVLTVGLGALVLVAVFHSGLHLLGRTEGTNPTATVAFVAQNAPSPTRTHANTPTATSEPTQAATDTPTVPPATDAPTSPPETPTPVIHVIQSGESLRSIAEQYGISIDDLAQANNIKTTSLILVGQQLVIPGQNPTATPDQAQAVPTTTVTYTVQKGDNLLSIALKYNTTVADLMAANGLSDGAMLSVGQQLTIPGQPGQPAQPTPAPTVMPTATLTPTEAVTVTAEAETAAPTPTPSNKAPTAAPANGNLEFPAPSLLSPADGAKQLPGEDVLLNWSSVGLLGDDTWYVVRIWRDNSSLPTPPAGWTRTTAWRIPASYQPAANASSHTFYWSVTVMRVREGETPVPVSQASGTRSFTW